VVSEWIEEGSSMSKISLGKQVFLYPMPVVLLGTMWENRPNFMAAGWISRVNYNPPLIGVGIGKSHLSADSILECNAFSINFPPSRLMVETDHCGLVSGRDVDKSGVFSIFFGELEKVPMVRESTLALECRLERTIDLGSNYLFIGEIVQSYSEDKYLTDGKPDIVKMDPLLLSMPDNNYWKVGEKAGTAWKDGLKYRKEGSL